ncbi:ABC transporter ATP-binding protein [Paenibacillus methanolicus]|uniref:ABC-2 type transport system ATP-binding protein n=1 Tax=Paenibacillus methanolicus TaxID=582686 RepID=A0A5S5BNB4_9BACL|nr:ABC transporter ATP-binding protein [Paenibacillus methanolicus]TYP68619.1 ABC-2 type transport system ATP-binding protein [Paenibacillus methanolicus]
MMRGGDVLNVTALTKRYDAKTVVESVNFTLSKMRCTALLGPNGAGKTTTIQMLAGLLRPSSGQIRLLGDASDSDPRRSIGYLPQHPAFYAWMSGREYMIYAGRLCGLTRKAASGAAEELLARVGLADAARERIGGYSGGMKQRLGIAQALIHRPKLLILDEPMSALDPIGRREVMALLRDIKRETTVLYSTHVLHDAEALCDDILILRQGELVESGPLSEVRDRNRQPVIVVETENDEASRGWMERWLQGTKADVLNADRVERGMRLVVRDLEAAREALLLDIARAGVRITRLDIGQMSLEDIFMKAVAE